MWIWPKGLPSLLPFLSLSLVIEMCVKFSSILYSLMRIYSEDEESPLKADTQRHTSWRSPSSSCSAFTVTSSVCHQWWPRFSQCPPQHILDVAPPSLKANNNPTHLNIQWHHTELVFRHLHCLHSCLHEAMAEWLVCGLGEPGDIAWPRFESSLKHTDFSSQLSGGRPPTCRPDLQSILASATSVKRSTGGAAWAQQESYIAAATIKKISLRH